MAKGMCNKHYYRIKKGQPLLGKTRFDRRPAIIDGDTAKLELASDKGYALVDLEMAHLDKYNWCRSVDGYAVTWYQKKVTKIHHIIMGRPPEGYVTDHISRDKLDNRKCNLRFVSQRDNMLNSTVVDYWFPKGINKPGNYKEKGL